MFVLFFMLCLILEWHIVFLSLILNILGLKTKNTFHVFKKLILLLGVGNVFPDNHVI